MGGDPDFLAGLGGGAAITPAWVRLMAAYNAEMNRRVYAAADALTEAQRNERRGAFFGSVQATLSHLAWGDRTWMHRFDGWDRPPGSIADSPRLYADWAELRALRPRLDAGIAAWAARVEADWLAGTIAWHSGVLGRDVARPTWVLVAHMFNHQTHHRGQAHALLTGFGLNTGDTDIPFILPFD